MQSFPGTSILKEISFQSDQFSDFWIRSNMTSIYSSGRRTFDTRDNHDEPEIVPSIRRSQMLFLTISAE